MADELSISTTNQAGDGWVDQTPGPVSSGYQAQNTLISSTLIGIDKSEVRPAPRAKVIIEPSGPIDVDGQPFMITSRITSFGTNAIYSGGSYYYIKVANGSAWNKKTLVAVTPANPPTYDYAKRGFYFVDSGGTRERCLNWIVYYPSDNIDSTSSSRPFRIVQPERPRLHIENFLNINGTATDFNVRFEPGDVVLFSFRSDRNYDYSGHHFGQRYEEFVNRPLGKAGGTFRIKFNLSVPNRNLRWYHYSIRETTSANPNGIIKASGRTYESNGNINMNVNEDLSFSPYSSISVFFKVRYHGSGKGKHIFIRNFRICASQEVSKFMRTMLEMQLFFTKTQRFH